MKINIISYIFLGKKPVPILIPSNVIPLLNILSTPEVRFNVGIGADNPFLFATSSASNSHVIGSSAISSVVDKIDTSSVSISISLCEYFL